MRASGSKFALPGLVCLCISAWISFESRAADKTAGKSGDPHREQVSLGQRIFSHQWVADDRNSHGGDGLGPVFNDRSCVSCHDQGGPGGGGYAQKNVDILTAFVTAIMSSNPACAPGSPRPPETAPVDRRELAAIHPG